MATIIELVKRFPIWIAIGVFALGAYVLRDFISGNVGDLNVGDCFDPPAAVAAGAMVKDVQHHPCSDLHGAEVFFIGKVPGDADAPYPSDEAFVEFVGERCLPAYDSYTGRDFDSDTTYDFNYLTPTASGWTDGDRTVDCFVVRVDGQSSKGSVKAQR